MKQKIKISFECNSNFEKEDLIEMIFSRFEEIKFLQQYGFMGFIKIDITKRERK